MKTKTYYSMSDLFKIVEKYELTDLAIKPFDLLHYFKTNTYNCGWLGMAMSYKISITNDYSNVSAVLNSEIVNKLLAEHVLPRLWERTVVVANEEDETTTIQDFVQRVASYILATYDHNKTLIDLYANNESKLLNSIKSIQTGVNVNKFNDMPKTTDLETDGHLTNITQDNSSIINENELSPLIHRLNDIHEMLHDIYCEWANEFVERFMVE